MIQNIEGLQKQEFNLVCCVFQVVEGLNNKQQTYELLCSWIKKKPQKEESQVFQSGNILLHQPSNSNYCVSQPCPLMWWYRMSCSVWFFWEPFFLDALYVFVFVLAPKYSKEDWKPELISLVYTYYFSVHFNSGWVWSLLCDDFLNIRWKNIYFITGISLL